MLLNALPFQPSLMFVLILTDLYSWLGESDAHGQLFPHEDVGVVRLGERSLQLVQLSWSEARSMSLWLRLLVTIALRDVTRRCWWRHWFRVVVVVAWLRVRLWLVQLLLMVVCLYIRSVVTLWRHHSCTHLNVFQHGVAVLRQVSVQVVSTQHRDVALLRVWNTIALQINSTRTCSGSFVASSQWRHKRQKPKDSSVLCCFYQEKLILTIQVQV